MQVFERGSAENNEDAYPKRTTLKRNGFSGVLFLLFGCLFPGRFDSKNHGVDLGVFRGKRHTVAFP